MRVLTGMVEGVRQLGVLSRVVVRERTRCVKRLEGAGWSLQGFPGGRVQTVVGGGEEGMGTIVAVVVGGGGCGVGGLY